MIPNLGVVGSNPAGRAILTNGFSYLPIDRNASGEPLGLPMLLGQRPGDKAFSENSKLRLIIGPWMKNTHRLRLQ